MKAAEQLRDDHGFTVDQCRELLLEELADWGAPEWASCIYADAGVDPAVIEAADAARAEAEEQVRNASEDQILEYMTKRSAAINEGCEL